MLIADEEVKVAIGSCHLIFPSLSDLIDRIRSVIARPAAPRLAQFPVEDLLIVAAALRIGAIVFVANFERHRFEGAEPLAEEIGLARLLNLAELIRIPWFAGNDLDRSDDRFDQPQ